MIEFDDVSFAYRAPAEGAGAPAMVNSTSRCPKTCTATGMMTDWESLRASIFIAKPDPAGSSTTSLEPSSEAA